MKSLFADLFKQNVAVEQEFDAITIGLASPEKIRSSKIMSVSVVSTSA